MYCGESSVRLTGRGTSTLRSLSPREGKKDDHPWGNRGLSQTLSPSIELVIRDAAGTVRRGETLLTTGVADAVMNIYAEAQPMRTKHLEWVGPADRWSHLRGGGATWKTPSIDKSVIDWVPIGCEPCYAFVERMCRSPSFSHSGLTVCTVSWPARSRIFKNRNVRQTASPTSNPPHASSTHTSQRLG